MLGETACENYSEKSMAPTTLSGAARFFCSVFLYFYFLPYLVALTEAKRNICCCLEISIAISQFSEPDEPVNSGITLMLSITRKH